MKRILSLTLVSLLCLGLLSGCGKKKDDDASSKAPTSSNKTGEDALNDIWGNSGTSSTGSNTVSAPTVSDTDKKYDRVMFAAGLDSYVTLGKTTGIEIDSKSEEYEKAYIATLSASFASLGDKARSKTGTVKKGDTVNISFVGKKDGVAFEGGTGTSDLSIGSGQFIPGFEEGLIGAEVGKTVDLDLTFPENYGSTELAGKAVVFTVTLNNIASTKTAYAAAGFKSEEEYIADLKKNVVKNDDFKNLVLEKFTKTCKVKEVPKADFEFLYTKQKEMTEMQVAQYGMDFKAYLSAVGLTEETFKKEVVTPLAEEMMILYATMDSLGLKVTDSDIKDTANEIATEAGSVTAEDVINAYGEYYIEYIVVNEKILDHLASNAKIK